MEVYAAKEHENHKCPIKKEEMKIQNALNIEIRDSNIIQLDQEYYID